MNIGKALLKGTVLGVIGTGVAVGYMAYKVVKEQEYLDQTVEGGTVEKAYELAHRIKTKGMEVVSAGLDKVVAACDVVSNTVANAAVTVDEVRDDLDEEIQIRHLVDEQCGNDCDAPEDTEEDPIMGKPRFDNLEQARAYDRLLNYLGSFPAVTEYMLQLRHVDSWDYCKALMIYECTHSVEDGE